MASGETKSSATVDRMIGRPGRYRATIWKTPRLFWGLVFGAAIALNSPASAQVSGIGIDVTVPTNSSVQAITGQSNVVTTSGVTVGSAAGPTTIINGQSGSGYYVGSGGSLTINNSMLENFTTTGGAGSGGGLGAGGAIFIDTGGSVTLNGVSFAHDSVIGGTGGAISPYGPQYGGTLNGIQPNASPDATPNGANGVDGGQVPDDQYTFGDGKGNGIPGCCHTNGQNALNGYGGNGGNGGPGTNGWATNPVLTQNNNIAIQNVAIAAGLTTEQTVVLATWIGGAIAAYADSADVFEAPLSVTLGITSTALAIISGFTEVTDAAALAADIQAEVLAQGALDSWQNQWNLGYNGNGGNGEDGGYGGNGAYGFGGGSGGNGGAYGLSTSPNAYDGIGGDGGAGGNGGFGAGGGAGGYAFGANQNGEGVGRLNGGPTSINGAPGAGGTPGFGGGVGSTGGVTGGSSQCGVGTPGIACSGGGGDGYGGAIFVNTGATLTITGNATFAGDSAIGGASLNNGAAGGAAGTDLFIMTGGFVNFAPGVDANGNPNVITFNGTIADNSNASIGSPTYPVGPTYPNSGGASLTVYAGETIFNGKNTYSGQTVINGGALGDLDPTNPNPLLNPGTNKSGAPNYALTDGSLQAADGTGLPTASNLNFSGPGRYTGGVLEVPGVQLTNGTFQPTTFARSLNDNPNPYGGGNPGGVQWTGSGGFAALNAPLTVTLNNNAKLTWGQDGFVPVGYSLIFGSATSNNTVNFTNPIDLGTGTDAAGTSASFLVANNGNTLGSTAILSGVISGSGDLSVGGGGFNGTLELTGTDTYTGATVIHSGTLELGCMTVNNVQQCGSIADSSDVTIESAGALDISGSNGVTLPSLNGSGTILLGSQELTVVNGGTFSGVLADGSNGTKGSLIIQGGTETLSGASTYTGDTTIDAGATLALSGIGSIADSSPVIDNGTFDITQTSAGASITTLSGSSTGVVHLGSQTLMITAGAAGALGTTADGVFSGVVDGAGNLVVTGGKQTLAGANTYTGTTSISGGATLALKDAGTIQDSANVIDYGTFDISLTTSGASIWTLSGTGNVALGSKTLKITNASTTFGGAITDGGFSSATGGKLEIAGGTETLSGLNTYTGTTTIDPGADLALSGLGSISKSAGVVDNGLFDISQAFLGTMITTLSGNGHIALGSELLAITAGGAGPTGASPAGVFSGIIADGGGAVGGSGGMLAVTGGVQTLSGVNTYTGGTLVEAGATLALSGIGSIATSAGVEDDGTFDISQTTSGASIKTLVGSGLISLGSQELTITNGANTFAGIMADGGFAGGTAGSLIVAGGSETLSGTNIYTGDTTIKSGGTLELTGTGSIATSSVVLLATGGTFDISQTAAGASIMTLADTAVGQAGSVKLGSQTLSITHGSTTFSGVIADGGIANGSGGALKVTGGTQTLAGINTYTGLTTINSGATLALSGNGSVSSSNGVVANGTFDISATTSVSTSIPPALGTSITTLSGSGNVALGGNYLTITAGAAGPAGTDPAGIFSGVVGGSGGMVISGPSSHEELTGLNTYTGGTNIINGGTLSVNNANSLGANTSPLTINNGALVADASITAPQPITFGNPGPNIIDLNSFNVTLSGALSGPGGFAAINGGTLNLTGTTSNIGSITIGPGTSLTTSSTASTGLAGTPIVVVSPTGGTTNVFTGSVHVVGTLDIVNSATPELIILPGDQLVGVGSVNIATVVQGGGSSAPGDGPGTIVATASVADLPSSTYTVQIDGPINSAANCPNPPNINGCAGQYSSTVVTGVGNTYTAAGTLAPQLTGIGAPANNTYIPPVTTSFIIVQAQGGVLGSFSSITQPAAGTSSSGGLAPGTRLDTLYYNTGSSTPVASDSASSPNGKTASQYAENPNAIALWVTPASYTNLSSFGVTLSQNETNVGSALNALRGPAGLVNDPQATWDFGYLFAQQPKNLPAIFDTLTGEVNADAAEGAFQLTDQFLGLMLDPFARPVRSVGDGGASHAALGFAAESQPGMPLDIATAAYAPRPPLPQKAATFDQRWLAWGSGFGEYTTISGDPAGAGTHNFATSTYGFAAGMDYTSITGTQFGFALAGGGSNWTVTQESLGTGNNYNVQGGLYGKMYLGPAYLGAALAVANNWMTTKRTAFGGDPLSASFDAQTFGARVEAGYGFIHGRMKFTPFAAGQVLAFRAPDYAETDLSGGGFALNYAGRTETDLSSQLGARFDALASAGNKPLIVRVRAAWEHDWLTNAGLAATFQAGLAPGALPGAGTSFVINGAALPQNLAVVSAGTDLYVTPATSISTKFDGQIAAGVQTYGGSLTLRSTW